MFPHSHPLAPHRSVVARRGAATNVRLVGAGLVLVTGAAIAVTVPVTGQADAVASTTRDRASGGGVRQAAAWHRRHHDFRYHSPIIAQPAPTAATPRVTPVAGTIPAYPAGYDGVDPSTVAAAGYREREFFISGTARAYRYLGTPGVDGRWQVTVDPGSAAHYRTRIDVLTPANPRRFSGTVLTEWNNVSGGYEAQPDLKFAHNTIFGNGDAYVGVTAQFVGAEAAKLNDPSRYGSLVHPGDSYSYDIFSQAGMAVWRDPRVLGGLRPRAQIADGESQSAGRMEVYVDAVAPTANVYNAFMVHSRGGTTFPLQEPTASATVTGPSGTVQVPDGNAGRTLQAGPQYAKSRTDLVTPVMYVMTETDVFSAPNGALDYAPATQRDSAGFRLWELAGTSHIDDYVGFVSRADTGDLASASTAFDAMLHPRSSSNQSGVFSFSCPGPINTGEHGYLFSAAVDQLERWVRTGGARTGIAASAPPLFAGQRPGLPTGSLPRRDADGIIIGGVRSPAVDVPVATLTGQVNGGAACSLLGTTTPFSAAKLASLYPTHRAFVVAWATSVLRLAREGYLTCADARRLIFAAAVSPVPATN